MSLRGATDFVATWQSRGSAIGFTANRFYLLLIVLLSFAMKSFDLEGWVGKSFLPFPKGWSRVVDTWRHRSVGAYNRERTLASLLCAELALLICKQVA